MKITSVLLVFTFFTCPLKLHAGKGDHIIDVNELEKLVEKTKNLSIIDLNPTKETEENKKNKWMATEYYYEHLFGKDKKDHSSIVKDSLKLISKDEQVTNFFNKSLNLLIESYDVNEELDKLNEAITNLEEKKVEDLLKKYIAKIEGSVNLLNNTRIDLNLASEKTSRLIKKIVKNAHKNLEEFNKNSSLEHDAFSSFVMHMSEFTPLITGFSLIIFWTIAIVITCIKILFILDEQPVNIARLFAFYATIVGGMLGWALPMIFVAFAVINLKVEAESLKKENRYFGWEPFKGDTKKRIEIKKILRNMLDMLENSFLHENCY